MATVAAESTETGVSIRDLREDTRHLYNSLYWEVAWKRNSLENKHWYLQSLLNNDDECRRICGESIIDVCKAFQKEHGRIPYVADIGCGPISSLAYLVHEGLADVLGLDAVADEYADLLAQYDIKSPVKQVQGIGEYMDREIADESFDIVFCRNALDHHQCPALAWLNMFKMTKVGGQIIQSHSIREATKEGWKQLHQFDLYPDEELQLCIEDSSGHSFSLTKYLPITKTEHRLNVNDDQTGWFVSHYRKEHSEIDSSIFWSNMSKQLTTSFAKRSKWAFQLEELVFKLDEKNDPKAIPMKLYISTERA